MLAIIRTKPVGVHNKRFLNATVTFRDGNNNIEGCPDITFDIDTYRKIAGTEVGNIGDLILLSVNLFFASLAYEEQEALYNMYSRVRRLLDIITIDNRKEIQDEIQQIVYHTIKDLKIPEQLIEFCKTDQFVYPALTDIGTKLHHMSHKTFFLHEYIEITAISLLSKMMVPIWGDLIDRFSKLKVNSKQKEKLVFDLIIDNLQEGPFERIYHKLWIYISTGVSENRKAMDKSPKVNRTTSSFVLTHNGIDDETFNQIVTATIIVKRMATYESVRPKNQKIPDAVVYIFEGIRHATKNSIQGMRDTINTMPHLPLPDRDTEDNASIIDHISKTSRKPADDPIFVETIAERYEIPRLLEETQTPLEVYEKAADYYQRNSFDFSPLYNAMVASFVGTRFGGSKCLDYLSPKLYQRLGIILQIFLIRKGWINLAQLLVAKTANEEIDGPISQVGTRIKMTYETTHEYLRMQDLIRGFLEKPSNAFTKKKKGQSTATVDRVDFPTHIAKLVEWLTLYHHFENMAPSISEFARMNTVPVTGSLVELDEQVIRNLCEFYLLFHGETQPTLGSP